MKRNNWYIINTRRLSGAAILRLPAMTPEIIVHLFAWFLNADYGHPNSSKVN